MQFCVSFVGGRRIRERRGLKCFSRKAQSLHLVVKSDSTAPLAAECHIFMRTGPPTRTAGWWKDSGCFPSPAVDGFSEVVPNDHAQFYFTHTMGTFQIRHQPILVLLCIVEEANSDATVHTWIRIYASTLGISRILHPHLSKLLCFRVSILTGRRAAWVPDSDTGGWQESLIFQHSRTYHSLKRQKGGHSYSYRTEEETGAWQCRFTDNQ